MTKRILLCLAVALMAGMLWAQGVKPLPTLHVEGKWIVDQHGNKVVLHGVMDTPNIDVNGGRWGQDYSSVTPCLEYFEKIFTGLEQAKCDVFRLHLDPAWSNDPEKEATNGGGQDDISRFSAERLKTYLSSLYWPLIQKAMNHGLYVVLTAPGKCPENMRVGDDYNQYLLTVWDVITQFSSIRKYDGQISIELADEPVSIKDAEGNDSPAAMHDFFQPIVDMIRANGFTGIIWAPGTQRQSLYTSYATNPIEGYNIGYAVHDYCGWYGCSDETPNATEYIDEFRRQVPVVETNPVIISEVAWNPDNGTGSTSKWGKAFKALLDHYANISMTLAGTDCLIDIDKLLANGSVEPAFGGMEEACGKACMDWYADYYEVDWPHADFSQVSVSDLGTGRFRNPVIFADFPDPDVIRVDDTFYMVSTTMHHFPGATIVKSKDLVNWEYCAQPLAQLSASDKYSLLNGQNAYAGGMWACSMDYHDGTFYILINGNDAGGWLLTATDPEGVWKKKKLPRIYYDPGMLFDNGKVYVACGIGNIQMCELDEDFNFIQEKRVISDKDGLEGCHLYKIGEYYYIYATYGGWPSGQAVFRSKNIFGPYEEKMLLEKYINGSANTIHQGALIQVGGEAYAQDEGQWWTILQQDLGCFGRMPNLQPVKWADGWPSIGNNGVPSTTKPKAGTSSPRTPMPTNDSFRSYPLGMQWQWNHNPDDGAWSLFDRPGWLRLESSNDGGSKATPLTQARNILTQRIFAYHSKPSTPSTGTIRLDVSKLQEGDRAGICILQDPYAAIAVEMKDGRKQIVWWQDQLTQNNNFTPASQTAANVPDGFAIGTESIVYLRATINYSTSKTQFYYSFDNKTFTPLGGQTTLSFNLTVFVGARFGLFCYNAEGKESTERGYADFDWFSTESEYDEATFYSADFEGFSDDLLTVESLELSDVPEEVMVGNNAQMMVTAIYRDGHTDNVAAKATYETDTDGVIEIMNGQIRGIGEGDANVRVTYTDPKGNTLTTWFTVRSTFFPFGSQYINTSLFSQGTYDESTRTFKPGQWGQMGWEYPNGADMSGYKYLVINLTKAQNCGAHLNIFTSGSIWGECYGSADFGSKKQIVINLQTAKYTSDSHKGEALNTKNIHIVAFWGNGNGTIQVDDMYLTNNSDYTREGTTGIEDIGHSTPDIQQPVPVYDLSGRRHDSSRSLRPGLYIKEGKINIIK